MTPEETAEELLSDPMGSVVPAPIRGILIGRIATALRAAYSAGMDAGEVAEREHICAFLAGENFGVGTHDVVRAVIDAIRER